MPSSSRRAELAFALLEQALASSPIRHTGARPINFELAGTAGTWSFDPGRNGLLFAPGAAQNPALLLWLTLEQLLALAGRGLDPEDARTIEFLGDLGALEAIRDSLRAPLSPVTARAAANHTSGED